MGVSYLDVTLTSTVRSYLQLENTSGMERKLPLIWTFYYKLECNDMDLYFYTI